jgi:cardiolipin synthase
MSLTFANKITVCRILAVPFLVAVVLYYSPQRDYLRYVALGIFLFAVISDVIDGYIARTRHQKTKAGAILDPLADKVLLMSTFICLYKMGVQFSAIHFPLWLVVAVISRDAILLVGAMLIYLIHGDLSIEATRWGKTSTFFQVLTVIAMLLQQSTWVSTTLLWAITVFFTVISGVDYIRNGIKLINIPAGQIASGSK